MCESKKAYLHHHATNIGVPQGCVFSPLLYTHSCSASHSSNHIIKTIIEWSAVLQPDSFFPRRPCKHFQWVNYYYRHYCILSDCMCTICTSCTMPMLAEAQRCLDYHNNDKLLKIKLN